MGHLRLGTLPKTKTWREVVALLEADAPLLDIADAAARASDRDLGRAADDPVFRFVSSLLANLPRHARGPGYREFMRTLGISVDETTSVSGLLAGIDRAVDRHAFEVDRSSDIGEMAKAALLATLSGQLERRLPSLFEPTSAEIRKELASFSSGSGFAGLARDFFARLTYRSLDYFLSRELANHTGAGQRFATDADRTAFQTDLAQHVFEASRIVEDFAGGWYGKTVWQKQALDQDAVDRFSRYAFKKLRSELGRRHAIS